MTWEYREVALRDIAWEQEQWDRHNCAYLPADHDATAQTLAQSVAQLGILQPLILLAEGDFYFIIAGARRFAAAKANGLSAIPAICLPVGRLSPLEILALALDSNLTVRSLTTMEKARAAQKLMQIYANDATTAAEKWAPRLQIPRTAEAIEDFAAFAELPQPLTDALATGRLDPRNAALILRLQPPDQLAVFENIFDKCQSSVSEGRELLELAMDLAIRERCRVREIFHWPELQMILATEQTGPREKCQRLRQHLHTRRYPTLANLRRKFADRAAALHKDDFLRVLPPKHFEADKLTLQLSLNEKGDLDRIVQNLQQPETAATIVDLLKISHEEPA